MHGNMNVKFLRKRTALTTTPPRAYKNCTCPNNAENTSYFHLWEEVIGEIVFGRSWTYTSGIYDHTLFENVACAHTPHPRARLNFMQYSLIL